jgi:hypothetical protein
LREIETMRKVGGKLCGGEIFTVEGSQSCSCETGMWRKVGFWRGTCTGTSYTAPH